LAVAAECADGVQKLLGHGANPNQRDAAGRSALDVAGHMPHAADIVRLLSKVAGI
jgi:ankyrin repeat protein